MKNLRISIPAPFDAELRAAAERAGRPSELWLVQQRRPVRHGAAR